jgi:hypothetical protein
LKTLKKRQIAVVDETEVEEVADDILNRLMTSNLAFYQMLGVLELVKLDLMDNSEIDYDGNGED